MNAKYFRMTISAVPLATLLSLPLSLNADTITGKLNGHDCAHAGTSCPVDRLDPHVALESDFVLMVGGGDYMFLPNVPRDVKVRYVLQDVQVKGTINDKYRSIKVDELHAKKGGTYATVWSQKAQDFEWEALHGDGIAAPGQKQ